MRRFVSKRNLTRFRVFILKSDTLYNFDIKKWPDKKFSIQNLTRYKLLNSKSITLYSSFSKIWCDVCFISSKSDMLWNLFIKIWPDEKCYIQNLMRSETLISKSNALFSLKSKSDVLYFLYSKPGASKFSSIPNLTRCKNLTQNLTRFFWSPTSCILFRSITDIS